MAFAPAPTRWSEPCALPANVARPYALVIVLFVLLGLLPLLPASSGRDAPSVGFIELSQSVAPGALPPGVSTAEWASIQTQIATGSYRAYPVADGSFRSANPAHGWQIAYGTDGSTRLSPRVPQANPWVWTLTLSSYGFQTRIPLAQPHTLTADGANMTYQWDATLTEWWRNTPTHLEQGFTLAERPGGGAAGQPLRLDLTLGGDLHPTADVAGITFRAADGSAVLTYRGLHAWDATGQALPTWLALEHGRITLSVNEANAVYPLTIDPWVQQAYLKASNTDMGDQLGWSVALSGDTLVIGAQGEDSNATGVNGNQADNSVSNAGAVYVFVRENDVWIQQAYLKASNTAIGDRFGVMVALSGNTLAVGAVGEDSATTGVNGNQADNSASNAGAVYVFVRSGSTWIQQAYLKASNTEANDLFSISLALSGDTLVVGASGESSNAIGVNGNQADNSAQDAGAVYVFVRENGVWLQQAYLKASNTSNNDLFSISLVLSGSMLAVGAVGEDSATTGVNGDQANNSATNSGAVYLFALDTTGPGVTINQADDQADPTSTGPITFTVVFTEPIAPGSFTSADVSLGGTAAGTLVATITERAPNNGTTFSVSVSGMTDTGTVTASLPAGVVTDLAGNPNTASAGTDTSVTYNVIRQVFLPVLVR